MKRMYILLSLMIVTFGLFANDYYYWYHNEKVFLEQGDERYVLYNPNSKSGLENAAFIKTGARKDSSLRWGVQKATVPVTSEIKYSTPSFRSRYDSTNIYVTERFYVKLKNVEDFDLLSQFAVSHNVDIVKESSVPKWYILSCTETTNGDAISMANIFYESHLFAAAEPEFINAFRTMCVNDPHFAEQWDLYNTGQYDPTHIGLDINYCEAHNITSGNQSVIIALIDDGVDSTHEDIRTPAYRYDVPSMSSPDSIYPQYHGTCSAGVIGAYANNSTGMAGIAPDCSLMSISLRFDWYTNPSHLADALTYAADHNADVINNPWSSIIVSDLIYDAIGYALVHGRNGKGCVVVFCAGNWNCPIMYPAETYEDIIVVGAMTPCGERKSPQSCDSITWWGSCYGAGLDVVAPGHKIFTADLMGPAGSAIPSLPGDGANYVRESGTSISCAHVSAIAGLVLSMNPNLTQKEVADIIESTAQKVGTYSYDSVDANGSWDPEMGYGLVDAYAAVQKARLSNIEIEGPTYACDSSYYFVRNVPDRATIQWSIGRSFFSALQYRIVGSNNRDSVLLAYDAPIKDLIGDTLRGHVSPPSPHDPPFPPISVNDTTVVLSVRVSKDGLSYTKRKTLYSPNMGTPLILSSDTATIWTRYVERTFTLANCYEIPDNQIEWKVFLTDQFFDHILRYQDRGRTINFTPTNIGVYDVVATNLEKECGTYSVSKQYNVVVNRSNKAKKKDLPLESGTTKRLHNGQLYILQDNKVYNAEGVRVR